MLFQPDFSLLRKPQLAQRQPATPVKVFAQDERRVGLLPIGRRRITACGVQPIATVVHKCENFYLYGAGAPTTGDSFLLERPGLKTSTFQLWVEHCAQAFPAYSPALNPLERLWRDLKDQLAGPRDQDA